MRDVSAAWVAQPSSCSWDRNNLGRRSVFGRSVPFLLLETYWHFLTETRVLILISSRNGIKMDCRQDNIYMLEKPLWKLIILTRCGSIRRSTIVKAAIIET
jgi:hypothetical protein